MQVTACSVHGDTIGYGSYRHLSRPDKEEAAAHGWGKERGTVAIFARHRLNMRFLRARRVIQMRYGPALAYTVSPGAVRADAVSRTIVFFFSDD